MANAGQSTRWCCKVVYDEVAVHDIVGTLVDACRKAVTLHVCKQLNLSTEGAPGVPDNYCGLHTWLASAVVDGVLTETRADPAVCGPRTFSSALTSCDRPDGG